jgi:hypothetical protein
MSGIERNALCPCGSGKKYKKCCDGVEKTQGPNKKMLGGLGLVILAALICGGIWGLETGMRVGIPGCIIVVGAAILFKAPGKKRDRNSGSNIDFGR